jgi:hypothetical protein
MERDEAGVGVCVEDWREGPGRQWPAVLAETGEPGLKQERGKGVDAPWTTAGRAKTAIVPAADDRRQGLPTEYAPGGVAYGLCLVLDDLATVVGVAEGSPRRVGTVRDRDPTEAADGIRGLGDRPPVVDAAQWRVGRGIRHARAMPCLT